jgi:predicted  nucleic acid-binding Zn-ribbon protein
MNRLIPAALLILPFLVAACSEREDANSPAMQQSAPTESQTQKPVAAKDVKQEAKEAVDTASQYATQRKREFVAKAEHDLADLGTEMDDLKTRARTATAETKAKMDDALHDLEREKAQAEQKLVELKSASADAWQDAKAGFQSALEKLRQSYEKAKQDFA